MSHTHIETQLSNPPVQKPPSWIYQPQLRACVLMYAHQLNTREFMFAGECKHYNEPKAYMLPTDAAQRTPK